MCDVGLFSSDLISVAETIAFRTQTDNGRYNYGLSKTNVCISRGNKHKARRTFCRILVRVWFFVLTTGGVQGYNNNVGRSYDYRMRIRNYERFF